MSGGGSSQDNDGMKNDKISTIIVYLNRHVFTFICFQKVINEICCFFFSISFFFENGKTKWFSMSLTIQEKQEIEKLIVFQNGKRK